MKNRDNIQVEFFFEFIYLFASSNLFFLILIIYIFSRHTTMRNMHMRKWGWITSSSRFKYFCAPFPHSGPCAPLPQSPYLHGIRRRASKYIMIFPWAFIRSLIWENKRRITLVCITKPRSSCEIDSAWEIETRMWLQGVVICCSPWSWMHFYWEDQFTTHIIFMVVDYLLLWFSLHINAIPSV